MMSRISNKNLQSQLAGWMKAKPELKDTSIEGLDLKQIRQASRDLGVKPSQIVDVQDQVIAQALAANENAGGASKNLRDAGQISDNTVGQRDVGNSALGLRMNQMMGAKGAKGGKGGTYADASDAMDAFSPRYSPKGDLGLPFVSHQGYKGGSPDLDAFFLSEFTDSDVAKLGETFPRMTKGELREMIGFKVNNGDFDVLREYGITPGPYDSHDMKDAFSKSDYGDASARQAVAAFPFLNTLEEAREYIGLKVINGSENILAEVGISTNPFTPENEMKAFAKSHYTPEDAKAAVQAFDFLDNVPDAKRYIGLKVINNYEGMLHNVGIRPGNFDDHENKAAFRSSTYSAADAEAAVKAFDFLDNASDAADYIGLKINNGYESMLAEAGITPDNFDRHDCLAAFRGSGYSDVDARMALTAFNFLDSVGEAKEYIGLKVVNGTEDILKNVGITTGQWDSHELANAYAGSSYNREDCKALAQGADFLSSPKEAREYIGMKIVNGTEYLLPEWGVQDRSEIDYDAKYGDWKSSLDLKSNGPADFDFKK
jgi:hypothetical protein